MEATTNDAARCSTVAGQAAMTARQASEGVTEFRALIRNQPVTMAALMLGLGYVLGRVAGGRHGRDGWR